MGKLTPEELHEREFCGARTRAGTPCKQRAIYHNGRCKFHGGLSTGPRTAEGKKRSAMNGRCPKRKRKSAKALDKPSHYLPIP
jgi:hypothetical protein